jgi:uncharacterized membrane protein YGL010W
MKIRTMLRTILRTILDISILCIIGICLSAIVVLSGNPKNQLACALLVGLCFSIVYILCGAVEQLKWWVNWADHLQISESTISRNLNKLGLTQLDCVVSWNNFADPKSFESSIHDTTAGGAKS